MKKLSNWARQNKWQARMVIIISWILLTILGIYIGITLKKLNAILPSAVFVASIIAYFVTFLIYPDKQYHKPKKIISFYTWQKSCDIVVAASSFIMVVYVANKPETIFIKYPFANAAIINRTSSPTDSMDKSYKSIKDFNSLMKDKNGNLLKWKERKKLLRTQLKALHKAGGLSKGAKVVLIFLSVIVAIGLLTLVAAAACSLSCNGLDAAAILVGIGGTALVVWLLIFLIRKITSKTRKQRMRTETLETSVQ